MSTPVPVSDAALLAAQAKAGQAGVDAYEAAKRELAQSRQGAVEQAMREASGRGAPREAAAAVQSQYTRPYDDRIASLNAGQASFEGSMAAREQRLEDYNAAVESARGLIGDQASQAVAPINAEADMRVRLARQQGQNAVDEIMAKLRLQQAQMEAAAAARARSGGGRSGGGGGGGGGEKLSQTELRAMLTRPAADKIKQAASGASQAIEQGFEERQDKVIGHRGTAVAKADYAMRQDALADALAAAAERAARTGVFMDTSDPNNPYGAGAGAVLSARSRESAADLAAQGREASQTAAEQRRQLQDMARPVPGVVEGPGANRFENIVPQSMLNEMAGSPLAPLYDRLVGQQALSTLPATQIYGQPNSAGQVAPSASEAMREAMILAAIDLQGQGYEFTIPELEAALDTDATWKAGSTAADVLNRSVGLDDVRSEQQNAERAAEQARDQMYQDMQREWAVEDREWTNYQRNRSLADDERSDADRELDEVVAEQETEFFDRTGIPASKFSGVPVGYLLELAASPAFAELQQSVAANAASIYSDDELVAFLTDAGLNPAERDDANLIRLFKAMYAGG